MIGIDRGRSDGGGQLERHAERRQRRARAGPARPTAERREPGGAATGSSSADHEARRCRVRAAVRRHRNGIRGRSTQRPSLASSAGSTVSEPRTATATTRMAPTASEEKVASRARNMPAIAMMTAMPETTTAWPEVSAAISIASSRVGAAGPLLALPPDVEQRVVDADRHADEQDHAAERVARPGMTCEAKAESPIAAATEVSASSSGTPAAISAPNATSRMTRVIGRLISSACVQVAAERLAEGLVERARRRPPRPAGAGSAACTAAVTACSGGDPVRRRCRGRRPSLTAPARPCRPRRGHRRARPRDLGERPAAAWSASAARGLRRGAGRARPVRAVISTFSTAGSAKWPLVTMRSARPESRTRVAVVDELVLVPTSRRRRRCRG